MLNLIEIEHFYGIFVNTKQDKIKNSNQCKFLID